jgi:hypothetical protein
VCGAGPVKPADLKEFFVRKISPFLWFDNNAEEAAQFYTSIFNN